MSPKITRTGLSAVSAKNSIARSVPPSRSPRSLEGERSRRDASRANKNTQSIHQGNNRRNQLLGTGRKSGAFIFPGSIGRIENDRATGNGPDLAQAGGSRSLGLLISSGSHPLLEIARVKTFEKRGRAEGPAGSRARRWASATIIRGKCGWFGPPRRRDEFLIFWHAPGPSSHRMSVPPPMGDRGVFIVPAAAGLTPTHAREDVVPGARVSRSSRTSMRRIALPS